MGDTTQSEVHFRSMFVLWMILSVIMALLCYLIYVVSPPTTNPVDPSVLQQQTNSFYNNIFLICVLLVTDSPIYLRTFETDKITRKESKRYLRAFILVSVALTISLVLANVVFPLSPSPIYFLVGYFVLLVEIWGFAVPFLLSVD